MLNEEKSQSKGRIDKKIKCTLVGDGAVGKATLAVLYAEDRLRTEYVPTIFDNYIKTFEIDNKIYQVDCHVTAGQEDYDNLRPLSYPSTDVFLICFSVVKPSSYSNVEDKWLPEVRKHCPNVPILLVGTQIDLRNSLANEEKLKNKILLKDDGKKLAKGIQAVKYVECSSLSKEGVEDVFGEVFRIALSSPQRKQKLCCCF